MPGSHIDTPVGEVILITSGDLRQAANEICWPAQEELERRLARQYSHHVLPGMRSHRGPQRIDDEQAQAVRRWLDGKGVRFVAGRNKQSELTDAQVHQQCKMYVASLRIAHEFGCDAIGIRYKQGLEDTVPASDLMGGLLNNSDRPPVFEDTGRELYAGGPLPHFDEVDECAGVDALGVQVHLCGNVSFD